MDKKYLVIGAGGMLGYGLSLEILKILDDPRNQAIGTWRSVRPEIEGFPLVRVDLAEQTIGDLVREFKPDIVYHLASETSLELCEKYPERVYQAVQVGLFSLIDACNEVDGKLVFMSSDGIFSRDGGEKNYEDTLPAPVNVYGRSKVMSEGLIRSMSRRWVIVRACPIGFHPSQPRGLVNWAGQQICQRKVMTGWTDCRFSPLTAKTLAGKLVEIQDIDNQIVHLSSQPGITKYDLLCRLVQIFDASPELVIPGRMSEANLSVPRPKNQVLHSRLALKMETMVPVEHEFDILKAEILARKIPPTPLC